MFYVRFGTFWYVLVGLTGRAQDICVVRVSFQLSSELLFTAVYPRTGGVSGNCSRNLPKPILKLSRGFSCETSDGNMFQSWAALTQMNCHSHFEQIYGLWWSWSLGLVPWSQAGSESWTAFEHRLEHVRWLSSKLGWCSIFLFGVEVTSISASSSGPNSPYLWVQQFYGQSIVGHSLAFECLISWQDSRQGSNIQAWNVPWTCIEWA